MPPPHRPHRHDSPSSLRTQPQEVILQGRHPLGCEFCKAAPGPARKQLHTAGGRRSPGGKHEGGKGSEEDESSCRAALEGREQRRTGASGGGREPPKSCTFELVWIEKFKIYCEVLVVKTRKFDSLLNSVRENYMMEIGDCEARWELFLW